MISKTACQLLIACVVLLGCAGIKPVTGQGLSGYIYLLRGNQMPSPGKPLNKGRGVSRGVFIYEPTTATQATGAGTLFSSIKTKLIAQTQSDSTGHYTINLPAGKYSVFIAEQGGFFAAESDGSGILNPVVITRKNNTKKGFTITQNAVF